MGENKNNQPVSENTNNQPLPHIVPESIGLRVIYGLATILLPVFLFLSTKEGSFFQPEWQDGRFESYLELMIGGPASFYFYPMLGYSMVCMGWLLLNPHRANKFFIRFGIYTGIVLALHYSLLLLSFDLFPLVLGFFAIWVIIVPLLFKWYRKFLASKTYQQHRKGYIRLTYLFGILAVISSVIYFEKSQVVLFLAIASLFTAGPAICLSIFLIISERMYKKYDRPSKINIWEKIGIFAWASAYLVAWRYSILKAIELYNQLPTSPPDCYIATAAAEGHPAVVRSWSVDLTEGGHMRVNAQLRYLKAAEISLKTISPNIHRHCRTWYDRYGRALANRLTTSIRANLAYLGLKPLEWVARIVLRWLLPDEKGIIQKLYTG
jgi:hypothetical protein